MSFILSKVFWTITQPSNFVVLALVMSCFLSYTRHAVWGRRLAAVCVSGLVILTILPVGQWLALPLVKQFPKADDMPTAIDGIIVLGGAIDSESSIASGEVELGDAADRVTALVALARRYENAQLVYAGGIGRLTGNHLQPSELARRFYLDQGLDVGRVIFEGSSRNTWENAVNVQGLIGQPSAQSWLLVTSAIHMPRAMGVFRRLGWNILPYPVDYRLDPLDQGATYLGRLIQPNVAASLGEFDAAAKEWIGLAAYWLMGRIESVFPSRNPPPIQ